MMDLSRTYKPKAKPVTTDPVKQGLADAQELGTSVHRITAEGVERLSPTEVFVTTDPDEGRRQIEAMQPPRLKVGDQVRLKAGGERAMVVTGVVRALYDYGNLVHCAWHDPESHDEKRDTFPASALVKVENDLAG